MRTSSKKNRLLEDFDYAHDPLIDRPQWISALLILRLLLAEAWRETTSSLSRQMSMLPLRLQGRRLLKFAKMNYKYHLQVLPYCPAEDRARLQYLLRKHAVRFAQFQLIYFYAIETWWVLVVAPYFVLLLTQGSESWLKGPCLPFLIAYMARHIGRFKTQYIRAIRLLLMAAVTAAVEALLYPARPESLAQYLTHSDGWPTFLCWMTLSLLYLAIATGLAGFLVAGICGRLAIRRYPEQWLLAELSFAMDQLIHRKSNLSQSRTRSQIINHLYIAAYCMRCGIPKAIAIRDSSMQAKVKETCARAASDISNLQIVVALSENHGVDLQQRIARDIALVACGNYKMLQSDLPLSTESRSLLRQVPSIVRTIIVALIPITVVVSLPHLGLRLTPDFSNWAVVISVIWMAVTLISVLDPLYRDRISAVSNFVSAFRGKD